MNLYEISLPSSLKSIGRMAFGFSGLKSFKIPKNVTFIDFPIFMGCKNLSKINAELLNPSFKSDKDVIYDGKLEVLLCLPPGYKYDSFRVPKSVKRITREAILSSKLKRIYIPKETLIDPGAFSLAPKDLMKIIR
jgi:hypothetical protein